MAGGQLLLSWREPVCLSSGYGSMSPVSTPSWHVCGTAEPALVLDVTHGVKRSGREDQCLGRWWGCLQQSVPLRPGSLGWFTALPRESHLAPPQALPLSSVTQLRHQKKCVTFMTVLSRTVTELTSLLRVRGLTGVPTLRRPP